MTEEQYAEPERGISGMFRDVMTGPDGRIQWDSGWQKNVIVIDCRRLLASFMRGAPGTAGITGMRVGRGDPNWDTAGIPAPAETQAALVDNTGFFELPLQPANIDFLVPTAPTTTGTPSNRLQVRAVLPAGQPPWTPMATLREFGLVATLGTQKTLVNYRTHPAISKDAQSTLERTIWLNF